MSPLTILIGVVVVATIGLSLWALFKAPENAPTATVQLNLPAQMAPEEQAYAPSVRIENIALSRAENFLHQEVTILDADAINDGPRSLQKLVVTVEFFDDMHQAVLRESRGILGNPPVPLGPGQKRGFQLSFDGVPSSWNMQTPSVRVGYLQLKPLK